MKAPARFGLAAGLIVAIACGTWAVGTIRGLMLTEHYVTDIGEQRSLALADGSEVQMNVRSSLSARVDETVRDLRLDDGDALFKVAKDPVRPFRVHTPRPSWKPSARSST